MKCVDRINARVLRRLPSRRSASRLESFDETGLSVAAPLSSSGEHALRVSWDCIDRVVATTGESLAGNHILLLFSMRNGGVIGVAEGDATFAGLADTLHLHLPSARRFSDWALKLLGSGGRPVEIFSAGESE